MLKKAHLEIAGEDAGREGARLEEAGDAAGCRNHHLPYARQLLSLSRRPLRRQRGRF
jgi:hypothetical protein